MVKPTATGEPATHVVLVHGIRSSATAWKPLRRCVANDPEMAEVVLHSFEYYSPTIDSASASPTQREVALKLDTFMTAQLESSDPVVMIGHSQGGLIIQHWLASYVRAGKARELSRVRSVILLACPNSGSDYLRTVRRAARGIVSRQEPQLRVLDAEIAELQQVILERVIYANTTTSNSCPIPFFPYAGEEDRVVRSPSALAAYPQRGMLNGSHRTILDFKPDGMNYMVLKKHILQGVELRGRETQSARPNLAPQVVVGAFPPNPSVQMEWQHAEQVAESILRNQSVLLLGPMGRGKSLLAAQYARSRVASGSPCVIWVDGTTEESLVAGLARLAIKVRSLAPSDRFDATSETASALALEAREYLDTPALGSTRPLLVVDNASDPNVVLPWLPSSGQCDVLLTSTNADFGQLADTIRVKLPDKKEAVRYLRARTDLTESQASEVAELVDLLPLALTQACSVLSLRRRAGQTYIEALKRPITPELLPSVPGYPKSFVAATLLAYESLRQGGAARRLQYVLSFMSTTEISTAFFYGVMKPSLERFGIDADSGLSDLVSRSMVAWSEDSQFFRQPDLVSGVLFEHLRLSLPHEYEAYALLVGDMLSPLNSEALDNLPAQGVLDILLECQRHFLCLIGRVKGAAWSSETAELALAEDAVTLSVLLHGRGVARDMSVIDSTAAEIRARILGSDDERTLMALNNLAVDHLQNGNVQQAREMQQSVFRRRKRVLGDFHEDTIQSAVNLANCLVADGDLPAAIEQHRWAVEKATATFGPEDRRTLEELNNFAAATLTAGDWREAESVLERVIEDVSGLYGSTDPIAVRAMTTLSAAKFQRLAAMADGELAGSLGKEFSSLISRVGLMLEVLSANGQESALEALHLRANFALLTAVDGDFRQATRDFLIVDTGYRQYLAPSDEHRSTNLQNLAYHVIHSKDMASAREVVDRIDAVLAALEPSRREQLAVARAKLGDFLAESPSN